MIDWRVVGDSPPEDEKVLICFGEPFFGRRNDEVETGYLDSESGVWKFWANDRPVVGFGVSHWAEINNPLKEGQG